MKPKPDPKAVVLLSGGLDSTTVLRIAQNRGFRVHALSFDYGQKHKAELEAAQRVAQDAAIEQHVIVKLDLRVFAGSALTSDEAIPKNRSPHEIANGIPVTYVPARNTVFLSLALAWAETLDATDIFIGVNALDYSGYPDCRPEFIRAFEKMANLGTRMGDQGRNIQIHTPLIDMTKAQIVQTGIELGVDYSKTITCYDPADAGLACGACDACQLRLKGFAEAGFTDPISYAR